jgi:hypothetical protein
MTPLNLPQATLNLSRKSGQIYVFCSVRKKKLVLTPEEWVRQHVIAFFVNELGVSIGKIASEYSLKYNNMNRRADIVVMNEKAEPQIIVECKAPSVPIGDKTLHQAAEYKHVISAKVLVLTNGLEHRIVNLISQEMGNDLMDLRNISIV